jgi:site-specific DNA-methyltransferase (adenine-specific)
MGVQYDLFSQTAAQPERFSKTAALPRFAAESAAAGFSLPAHQPGRVRDAIVSVLSRAAAPMSTRLIYRGVLELLGETPPSSVRSYLQLNTPALFSRTGRGEYRLQTGTAPAVGSSPVPEKFSPLPPPKSEALPEPFVHGRARLYHGDCFELLRLLPDNSVHAVVTDPPYGLREYSPEQQRKLRSRAGGVWRIPPSFDGCERSPLPRFTTLTPEQLRELREFFLRFAVALLPKLVPGANVLVAANPLLSHIVSTALADAGLERRGEIIRLVMTMRGGDRPKGAHREFDGVSVMPRSMWEPWLAYRRAPAGKIQDNLRRWRAGGFRRPGAERPFGDVIQSAPTRGGERRLAPHPSLKPQEFLRQIVRGALPLGEGVVLDPFAGAGSTLAAAEFCGYESIGFEKDAAYFETAKTGIPRLAAFGAKTAGQAL